MNSLSWFLYMADVLPSLSWAVAILSIVVGAVSLLCMAFISDHTTTEERSAGVFRKTMVGMTWAVILSVLLFFVSFLVPSKETIYLIAGSEAGEYVATTPQAQEILNDVHEIIKSQLSVLKNTD